VNRYAAENVIVMLAGNKSDTANRQVRAIGCAFGGVLIGFVQQVQTAEAQVCGL
jgi:hypothetical protein